MRIDCEKINASYRSFVSQTLARFLHTPAKQALANFSHSFSSGVTIILGPNGAGKSTLLQLLTGNRLPSSGRIRFAGNRVDPANRRPLIRFLPQNFDFYPRLTAYETLEYIAILQNITPHADRVRVIEKALRQTNLVQLAEQTVGLFSRGMKQRLGLAQALLVSTPVLILDEPTAGLDPEERRKIHRLLSTLGQDRTVIFASSLLADIACASSVLILDQGQCKFAGTPAEMAAQSAQVNFTEQSGCDAWNAKLQAGYRAILSQELAR